MSCQALLSSNASKSSSCCTRAKLVRTVASCGLQSNVDVPVKKLVSTQRLMVPHENWMSSGSTVNLFVASR